MGSESIPHFTSTQWDEAFINTGLYLSTVEFMIFICVYIYIYEPDWGPLNPKIDLFQQRS